MHIYISLKSDIDFDGNFEEDMLDERENTISMRNVRGEEKERLIFNDLM